MMRRCLVAARLFAGFAARGKPRRRIPAWRVHPVAAIRARAPGLPIRLIALTGYGRPSDIDLLLDVADNISPGPYPVAADPNQGLDAVPFPPRQTTICPLGPSSVAPITSAIRRFRHEFEAKITRRNALPVSAAPAAPAEVAP